jgi:heme oxygenase
VRSAVARLLKQHTAHSHERVEATLGLLDAGLSSDRLRTVLGRFAGFWQGTERLVDEWAAREAATADALNWPRRRRAEVLRQDLLRLGLTVRDLGEIPEAPPVFGAVDTAAALGWLYVSEGSTLGGAVIDRALRALPDGARLRVRTFAPYLEGPGPMWRSYLCCLDDWVGTDEARRDGVLAASLATFTALEAWLSPISAEAAA